MVPQMLRDAQLSCSAPNVSRPKSVEKPIAPPPPEDLAFTVWLTVVTTRFPAKSVAVTLKLCIPDALVESAAPLATVPLQVATPEIISLRDAA